TAAAEAVGQVFNLGSDEEVSIEELARRVIRLTGSSSRVEYVSYDQAYGPQFDDLPRRVPKLDKLRGVIPFTPRYRLDEIIGSVIAERRLPVTRPALSERSESGPALSERSESKG